MGSKQAKRPIDEIVNLSKAKQQILFAGFVRNTAPKSQIDILLTSAIFIISIFAEFIPEKWNKSLKSKHIIIDGLSVTLTECQGIEKSVYCSKIVKTGKHK